MEKNENFLRRVALTTALILGGCATDQEAVRDSGQSETVVSTPSSLESLPVDPAEALRSTEAVNLWLNDAQAIVDTTQNPVARDVLGFLRQSGVVTGVGNKGVQVVETPKQPGAPFIFPIGEKDIAKGGAAEKMAMDPSAAAFYYPQNNSLALLNYDKFSPNFRGLMALHEGKHAREFTSNPYNWEDQEIFARHELSTHLFENQLMLQLGGDKYKQFIDAYASEIISNTTRTNGKASYPNRGEYRATLDEIFGPASSDLERNLRQTHVWMDAMIRSIDATSQNTQEADHRRMSFMKSLYAKLRG
jgi:hypothetical protein